jgi:hypothetical protein
MQQPSAPEPAPPDGAMADRGGVDPVVPPGPAGAPSGSGPGVGAAVATVGGALLVAAGIVAVVLLGNDPGAGAGGGPDTARLADIGADIDRDLSTGTTGGDIGGIGGPRIEGDGFAYGLPPGWRDQPALHKQFGGFRGIKGSEVLQVLSSSPDPARSSRGGYVAVLRSPAGGRVGLEHPEDDFLTGTKVDGVQARLRGSPRETQLAGEDAIEFDFVMSSQGVEYRGAFVHAIHDDALYILMLTVLADGFEDANAGFRHITDTWRWR